MYTLIGISVLVWAVLFGAGIWLWWATSRPARGRGRITTRPGGPHHRAPSWAGPHHRAHS